MGSAASDGSVRLLGPGPFPQATNQSRRKIVGVYIAPLKSGIALNDATHAESTLAVLAQSVGVHAKLPNPPQTKLGKAATVSRWREAGTPITARWRGQELVELRIGNAEP